MASKKVKGLEDMTADELRALKGEKNAAARAMADEAREIQGYLTALEAAGE